ncbi:MAG: 4Fe-4S dicluster domain-containing protein [Candidatus Altiarchaeales archaeon]|nr:4Fe-4S dicluster domain-containing protein [Candidatus Altiarchaeales archaeon]
MSLLVSAILVLGVMAAAASLLLYLAARRFEVKQDPRLDELLEVLPGANCGACGYASCEAYAGKLLNKEALVTGCVAGGSEVIEKVAAIMGEECGDAQKKVARLRCLGGSKAKNDFTYDGLKSCEAASLVAGGQKACKQGCLGFGDCVAACPFDAISMGDDGLPIVDSGKCTACGVCVETCPKNLFILAPADKKIFVACMNTDIAADVMKKCGAGCIACRVCEKTCPVDAIHVINNVAKIDFKKCVQCGQCVAKCPRKIIVKREP